MPLSGRSEKGSLGLLFPKSQHKKGYDIATTRNNLFATMTLHCLSPSGSFLMQLLKVSILISKIISSYAYIKKKNPNKITLVCVL